MQRVSLIASKPLEGEDDGHRHEGFRDGKSEEEEIKEEGIKRGGEGDPVSKDSDGESKAQDESGGEKNREKPDLAEIVITHHSVRLHAKIKEDADDDLPDEEDRLEDRKGDDRGVEGREIQEQDHEIREQVQDLREDDHEQEHDDPAIRRGVVGHVAIDDREIGDEHDDAIPDFERVRGKESKAVKPKRDAVIGEEDGKGEGRESHGEDLVFVEAEILRESHTFILFPFPHFPKRYSNKDYQVGIHFWDKLGCAGYQNPRFRRGASVRARIRRV